MAGLVYVSMSDEVVDRMTRRRGSHRARLAGTASDRRAMSENTERRRFATSEVRDGEETGA